jgi:hypothetical protein
MKSCFYKAAFLWLSAVVSTFAQSHYPGQHVGKTLKEGIILRPLYDAVCGVLGY